MSKGVKDQAPPLIRVERGGRTPLSFAQERLWFLAQFMPNSPLYNISRMVRLEGRLDLMALERVINEVIRRHEALRTRFEIEEGEPSQIIDPWEPRELVVEDLTGLTREEKDQEVGRITREDAGTGFDLSRGPLLRVKVLKLEEDEHVLLYSMSHIVSDGWSTGILIGEVRLLYQAFIAGEPAPLAELPIQYADFAIWQRAYLQGERLRQEIEYWREQLVGIEDLQLPTDYARPAAPTYQGANRYFAVDRDLAENLRSLSRREGVTLYMTLMAAFKVVLMKYSGAEDVSVGTVIANRTRKEIEGLIGFFINTLVMRTNLSGNPNFRELLKRERRVALGAYGRQELPFEKLVEELNPQRDLSRSPLFQVMMILHNTEREVLELKGVKLSGVSGGLETDGDVRTAKFDLTVSITDLGQGLAGTANYSLDLFEGVTIERLMSHYANVLMAVAEQSEKPISELSLFSAQERAQIVVEWNETGTPYPQHRLIHELFERQVESATEAVALIDKDRWLSYAELNARANQLARYLRRLDVGPESLVGVCLERSLEMVIGLLATLKAGAAYLPLDPEYPAERIAYMVEDAQVKALLTHRQLSGLLRASEVQTIVLDAEWTMIASESVENLHDETTAENLAYAIYTSGSTGRPKGVMVPHRQVVNFFTAMDVEIDPDPAGGWLAVTSVSFDISVLELLWTLARGFQVVAHSETGGEDGSLAAQIIRHQVTHLQCTPSMAKMLSMEAEWIDAVGSLRKLIIGGESFPSDLAEKLRGVVKGEIRNMYGPTETTVWSATYALNGDERNIPIGRPVANTQIYILDQALEVVPVGVAGELYIGGEGVVRGYLKQAEITGARFLPDAFSAAGGNRLYRTGDLARYRENGRIEFLGRVDHQVKIRGYRIELGEIEAELGAHPAVSQRVVIAHEDEAGDKRLVAYVVYEGENRPGPEELRNYLKERLPEYMTPWWFVALEELPLTPNGKVDRRALPAPDVKGTDGEDGRLAPRTPVEEIVAGIFEELLKPGRVGIHDNFFELGGHSLLAMKLISRIRASLGTEIGVRSVFEFPTVEGLAGRIEESLKAGEMDVAPPLVRINREGQRGFRLPLSFAQQRLWFIDQLEPGSTAYNIPGATRLEGRLDLQALEKVINEIVRRHETLRTRFEAEDGALAQVIDEWEPWKLEVIDLRSLPLEEREAEVERRKREEAKTGFDLSKGPLLRVKALVLEEEQYLALFSMHHIISDRWSMGILIKEVGALYTAYTSGESSPLPELEIQYADYTLWQRQWLQGEVLEKQLAYWKRQLAGTPSLLQAPADRPRPATPTYNGAYEGFVLSEELSERLKRLGRDEDVTLFMILLAAFQLLLARYSGQERIAVGTPIAGRNRKETEGVIGFFVNTLVMVTDISGNPTAGELLKRVRETAIGAFMHQDLPFEKLVEEVQPERDLRRQPLFQVMFTFQNRLEDSGTVSNLGGRNERVEVENAKFEISLTAVEHVSQMTGNVEYATDIYERESMVRLLQHFERLLEGIAANRECPVMDIQLLSQAEWEQVLAWNRTAVEYAAEKVIHQLFEEQADRSPDRIAVIAVGKELSYGELNRRANQLGNYLRRRGIGPEIRVGICLERGVEMLVALLGILKAGGAYVPLDPTYPAERLNFMLEDAAAPLIVTQESLRGQLEAGNAELICMDSDHGAIVLESGENTESGASGENLTYVIYTSGSTGRPKGAMITHRSAVNLVTDAVRKFRLERDSRFLQFASLSFDVAVEEIYPVLSIGGAVVLLSDNLSYSYSDLTETIERHDVTTIELPTAYWRAWMRESLRAGSRAPRCLDLVITGDERISAETFKEWKEHEVSLLHVYGVTEATVNSMVYLAPSDFGEGESQAAIPIGNPIANTEVYLLDDRLQPTPLRIPGEMYLGGAGLARGYLNRPELTAERFAPSPFGNRAGSRLYKSGDLARRSPVPLATLDGCLEFVGRVDHQIKIRGYRVELGEIEAALKSHPMTQEAVVTAVEDGSGSDKLIAYVAPKYEHRQAADEMSLSKLLRSHIKAILPSYMTPSSFVFLDSLPLSPNGKVDRWALPEPGKQDVRGSDVYVAPSTPIEEDVARIFGEVLGIENIGIYDDFFALGGHSLLVMQVVNRVNNAYQIKLPIRTLFDGPSVNDLVAAIVESQVEQLGDDIFSQMLAEIGELSEHE
jgi:amino acid adenylation domain-containing protein